MKNYNLKFEKLKKKIEEGEKKNKEELEGLKKSLNSDLEKIIPELFLLFEKEIGFEGEPTETIPLQYQYPGLTLANWARNYKYIGKQIRITIFCDSKWDYGAKTIKRKKYEFPEQILIEARHETKRKIMNTTEFSKIKELAKNCLKDQGFLNIIEEF